MDSVSLWVAGGLRAGSRRHTLISMVARLDIVLAPTSKELFWVDGAYCERCGYDFPAEEFSGGRQKKWAVLTSGKILRGPLPLQHFTAGSVCGGTVSVIAPRAAGMVAANEDIDFVHPFRDG